MNFMIHGICIIYIQVSQNFPKSFSVNCLNGVHRFLAIRPAGPPFSEQTAFGVQQNGIQRSAKRRSAFSKTAFSVQQNGVHDEYKYTQRLLHSIPLNATTARGKQNTVHRFTTVRTAFEELILEKNSDPYCTVRTYIHVYLLSRPMKFARSVMWLGRTELRMGPLRLCTVTMHIQYSLRGRGEGGGRGGGGGAGGREGGGGGEEEEHDEEEGKEEEGERGEGRRRRRRRKRRRGRRREGGRERGGGGGGGRGRGGGGRRGHKIKRRKLSEV